MQGLQFSNEMEKESYDHLDDVVYQNKENDLKWIDYLERIKTVAKYPNFSVKLSEIDDDNINLIVQNAERHGAAAVPSIPLQNPSQDYKERNQCQCGCKRMKGNSFNLTVRSEHLHFLGSGVILYFFFIKICIILLASTAFFYTLFSFVTNMIGNEASEEIGKCKGSLFCIFKVSASILNKFEWRSFILIQYWLSILIAVIWVGISCYLTYQGNTLEEDAMRRTSNKPSAKAIKIQNLLAGFTSQQIIKKTLEKAWLQRPNRQTSSRSDQIQIKAIHIIYNMRPFREKTQKIQEEAIDLWKCFERSTLSKCPKLLNCSEKQYISKKNKLIGHINDLKDSEKGFWQETERQKYSTECAIVEFATEEDQQDFMKAYGVAGYSSFWRWLLIKCNVVKKNQLIQFHGDYLSIQAAPEPEDLYWQNAEQPYSYKTSVLILSGAVLIVIITAAIVAGIDVGQNYLLQQGIVSLNVINLLNYVKTVLIVVFNLVIEIALYQMIKRSDRKHTLSQQLITLISMSTFAQCINSILLPFVIQVFTNKNYYGSEGVAGLALDFAISSVIVSNLLLFFDLSIFKKLVQCITCLRNCMVRYKVSKLDYKALKHQVPTVNQFYEGGDFNMNKTYTQVLVDLLHMAFFATMQPFIILIFLIGNIVKWCLLRYLLLRRYNYPKRYHRMVFDQVLTILKLLPIFLGCGMIVTIVTANRIVSHWYLFIPSGVCLLIGFITAINPYSCFDLLTKSISKLCVRSKTRLSVVDEMMKLYSNSELTTQYFKNSNLIDLLGYKSKLEGKNQSQAYQRIQRFVNSAGSKSDD